MGLRNWIVAGVLLVGVTGAGLVLAREPESQGTVTSQQLFVEPLAGDDSKEVIAQTYIFPPGTVLPWHGGRPGFTGPGLLGNVAGNRLEATASAYTVSPGPIMPRSLARDCK